MASSMSGDRPSPCVPLSCLRATSAMLEEQRFLTRKRRCGFDTGVASSSVAKDESAVVGGVLSLLLPVSFTQDVWMYRITHDVLLSRSPVVAACGR